MRKVKELALFEDRELLMHIVYLSLGIVAAGLAAVAIMLLAGVPIERFTPFTLLGVALVTGVALVVHELVHAAFFILMGGWGTRIRFGACDGMLFTEAPGLILPVVRFCVVLLAPAVLVTAGLVALGLSLGMPLATVLAAGIHLSGCAGDLMFLFEIVRAHAAYVEDTGSGIRMYC